MPRKVPLPDWSRGTAILSRESEEWGLGRERLRSADVDHPFHGMASVGLDLQSVVGLCRAYEPLLQPGQYFSHTTAAALHGIPLPLSVGPLPLHISAIGGGSRPRRASVAGHVYPSESVSVALGFPVVAPSATWFHVASQLGRNDLVAAGDYLITGKRIRGGIRARAHCTVEQLGAIVRVNAGKRGSTTAMWALPRLRSGVDSAKESLLRLVLVSGGFPEPVIGVEIPVDSGRLTLTPDLALPFWRVIFEYEGETHRTDKTRFRRDIRRRELFEAANWRVIRVTADDLGPFLSQFYERVREVLALRERERANIGPTWNF